MGFCVILDIKMLFHMCIKFFSVRPLFLCLSKVHWLRRNALCDLLTKRKLTLNLVAYPPITDHWTCLIPLSIWFFIFRPEAWIKWSKGPRSNSQPYFSESVSFSWVVWTLRKLLFLTSETSLKWNSLFFYLSLYLNSFSSISSSNLKLIICPSLRSHLGFLWPKDFCL